MTNTWQARSLDLERFADAAGQLSLHTPLAELVRVSSACDAGAVTGHVCDWSLSGDTRGSDSRRQVWLRLQAGISLPQHCQRCLEPMSIELTVDRWFRCVADEATALAEDDGCEEDLLVLSAEFNALELLEDELLMALPLIISHGDCQPPSSPALGDDLPHPFAALAGLKTPRL